MNSAEGERKRHHEREGEEVAAGRASLFLEGPRRKGVHRTPQGAPSFFWVSRPLG